MENRNLLSNLKMPDLILRLRRKKIIYIILAAFFLVILIFLTRDSLQIGDQKPLSAPLRTKIAGAKARVNINQEFQFPLKNSKGSEVSKIKYTIESAELRNEILLKGKKASAVSGRIFFIVNVKITNDFNQSIEINSKDYVRLAVGGKEGEFLAADIHNDPVKVQPISTKYTRLGFPVNDSDKNFILKIGEISGEKTDIEVEFK